MLSTVEQMQLPDYDNPPVVETVVGVQFSPLNAFSNAHLGAFWQTIGPDQWPLVADAAPLPMQTEQFTPEAQWGKALRLQLTQNPSSRIQMTSPDQSRMLQLQNGRIHLNWLGKGGDQYPRYSIVREEFESCLVKLMQFADSQQLGAVVPDQWEVTYVNHIPQDGVWTTPRDWSFFQPLNAMRSIDGLIEAESFNGEWHFVIPDNRGRLHINWQHAKDDGDNSEFIRLAFTARGPTSGTDINAVLSGIDLGHETIVRAFRMLMSDEANNEWRLSDAADA